MKKILIVAPYLLPIPAVNGGAIETLIDYFINENKVNHKFEIVVISYGDCKDMNQSDNITDYRYVKRGFMSKLYDYTNMLLYKLHIKTYKKSYMIKKVNNLIKEINFDAILIEGNKEYIRPLNKNADTSLLLHIHHEAFKEKSIENDFILSKVDRVICVSEYIKNSSTKNYMNFVNKFCVLRNCCDNSFHNFQLKEYENANLRKSIGFDIDDFIIIFIGRITEEKGLKELIKAINMCKSDVKLIIIGNSSFGANKMSLYASEIMELIRMSNKKIEFLGQITHDKIGMYLKMSNVQVIPSIWEEPGALALIEGMAVGIPLICTNSGGMPEYLYNDYELLVCKEEHLIEQLTEKIEYLYSNKSFQNDISKKLISVGRNYTTYKYFIDLSKLIED